MIFTVVYYFLKDGGTMKRIIPYGHGLLSKYVTSNDITIDATCGNGNDTLLLCRLSKHVYGFDIQKQAIQNTESLLTNDGYKNFTLFQKGHEHINDMVKDNVKAIIYNLGYLPGGDTSIISKAESTIESLRNGLTILDKDGLILITLYIGHQGGQEEANAVEQFSSQLPSSTYNVLRYQFINKANAPYVIAIQKTK